MILKNSSFNDLTQKVISCNQKIVIYGAGMIGQIIVPHIIKKYSLYDNVTCFIDMDKNKIGQKITVEHCSYPIKSAEYLNEINSNSIILVTNSKFIPVINFLDSIPSLASVETYIIPVMQLSEANSFPDETEYVSRRCEKQLIPKKIHYCWFGRKPLPTFLKKCIDSWKQLCPDYEIIEWNEDNYNVLRHAYTKQAYEKRRFGFVTDVARLDILYEYGGIYLDTDVMLLKSLNDLLYQEGFIGTEKWGNINSGGGCGFSAGNSMLKELIDYRDSFSFVRPDGSVNTETNGMYETAFFSKHGFIPDNSLQIINDITIYPSYVFHPYDYMSSEIRMKKSTISVHHFYGGWMSEDDKQNRENTQKEYTKILNRMNRG